MAKKGVVEYIEKRYQMPITNPAGGDGSVIPNVIAKNVEELK